MSHEAYGLILMIGVPLYLWHFWIKPAQMRARIAQLKREIAEEEGQ